MFLGNTLGLINNANNCNSTVLMNCGAYIIVHMFASTLANAVQGVNSSNSNNNSSCLANQMSLPLL